MDHKFAVCGRPALQQNAVVSLACDRSRRGLLLTLASVIRFDMMSLQFACNCALAILCGQRSAKLEGLFVLRLQGAGVHLCVDDCVS